MSSLRTYSRSNRPLLFKTPPKTRPKHLATGRQFDNFQLIRTMEFLKQSPVIDKRKVIIGSHTQRGMGSYSCELRQNSYNSHSSKFTASTTFQSIPQNEILQFSNLIRMVNFLTKQKKEKDLMIKCQVGSIRELNKQIDLIQSRLQIKKEKYQKKQRRYQARSYDIQRSRKRADSIITREIMQLKLKINHMKKSTSPPRRDIPRRVSLHEQLQSINYNQESFNYSRTRASANHSFGNSGQSMQGTGFFGFSKQMSNGSSAWISSKSREFPQLRARIEPSIKQLKDQYPLNISRFDLSQVIQIPAHTSFNQTGNIKNDEEKQFENSLMSESKQSLNDIQYSKLLNSRQLNLSTLTKKDDEDPEIQKKFMKSRISSQRKVGPRKEKADNAREAISHERRKAQEKYSAKAEFLRQRNSQPINIDLQKSMRPNYEEDHLFNPLESSPESKYLPNISSRLRQSISEVCENEEDMLSTIDLKPISNISREKSPLKWDGSNPENVGKFIPSGIFYRKQSQEKMKAVFAPLKNKIRSIKKIDIYY